MLLKLSFTLCTAQKFKVWILIFIHYELAQKFMQVWIDVTCMHTNFGGCGLSGFRDTATFKNG